MPDFVPIDHDPFSAPQLIPVDHDPFNGLANAAGINNITLGPNHILNARAQGSRQYHDANYLPSADPLAEQLAFLKQADSIAQERAAFFDTSRSVGNMAPNGIPWQAWRRSTNIEDSRLPESDRVFGTAPPQLVPVDHDPFAQ